jgi:putative inorganic carbon (HCO3(-)) transporter
MWFSIMKPDEWAYAAGVHSTLIATSTLISGVRHSVRIGRLFRNPITAGLLALLVPITVSVFTAVDPSLAYLPYREYVNMLLMILLTPLVLDTGQDLKYLLLTIALSIGLIGARFGISGLMHGGARFSEGYGHGMLGDNNTLALGLAMGIPLCWYSRELVNGRWLRSLLLGCVLLSAAAIIMTYSRGGALCLALVFLLIAMRARHKVLLLTLFVVMVSALVYVLGDTYVERLGTLRNPEEEGSARARILAARAAIAMWKDYPLTGVGFGGLNQMALQARYIEEETKPMVVHNTYLELLVGSGIAAFLIYIALLVGCLVWLGTTIRTARQQRPDLVTYAFALQTSLVTFCLGSYFLSRVTYDMFYMVLAATALYWDLWRKGEVMSDYMDPATYEGI